MGEVYRARDTRLNRDVALKVLPDAFSRDTQCMARFEREAKLLASLNHPNIAAIYGIEESGPIRAPVTTSSSIGAPPRPPSRSL
jgi:serine/threonine protein kinase